MKRCAVKKKVIKETNVKQNKITFADAVKKNSVSPELKVQVPLVIKPKEKQKIEKTKEDLNKKIDSIDFKITNIKSRGNGTVIIQSENKDERNKIKNVIENKMSETYEIKVPSEIEMVIVMTHMTFKYEEK